MAVPKVSAEDDGDGRDRQGKVMAAGAVLPRKNKCEWQQGTDHGERNEGERPGSPAGGQL